MLVLQLILLIVFSLLLTYSTCQYTCPIAEFPIQVVPSDVKYHSKPYVNGAKTFIGGEVKDWGGASIDVTSPIIDESTGKPTIIGKIAQMLSDDAVTAVDAAKKAWDNGRGKWPQMNINDRIIALRKVVEALKSKRDEIINVLTWEICKTSDDAAAEFDRTMSFIDASINAFIELDKETSGWKTINGIIARVRRAAIGIMMCLGPFNYPFNETYATLFPALLAGNIIIMKIPTLGGLVHMLTMEAYAQHLPMGTINFVSGSGRTTIGPMMKTGAIDILAFIGGSKAADAIIKEHPHPHRLKIFLQLEGKNLGIVLDDADLDVAAEQVTIGSTTYNGQRCTAIKLTMVHESVAKKFLEKLKQRFAKLKYGLPWEEGVLITPLPEDKKTKYMESMIEDAVSRGATVVNSDENGGMIAGNLMVPAIVYPVDSSMRLWHEEQFGPVVPVAVYKEIEEVFAYIAKMPYGQQAAIFTSNSASSAPIVDVLSTVVGRININTQCGRSPDVLPFSGRRSSAMGTMSITESLKVFSVETVVAAKSNDVNESILKGLDEKSTFLK